MNLFFSLLPTLVNTLAILLGAVVGLSMHGRVSERFRLILFQAIGLTTLIIGVQYASQTREIPILALSMIFGGLLGEALKIEGRLDLFGERLKTRLGYAGESKFTEGFMYASLLFCVGAMTIVGSFQAGVEQNGDLLYTKSVLDGHVAIFFAGTLGIGVLASAGTVLAVQGLLTIVFMGIGSGIPEPVVREISAAGGLLIIGISLNLLEVCKIRLGNLLPSLVFAGVFVWLKSFLF